MKWKLVLCAFNRSDLVFIFIFSSVNATININMKAAIIYRFVFVDNIYVLTWEKLHPYDKKWVALVIDLRQNVYAWLS